jgi:hypothetical protein
MPKGRLPGDGSVRLGQVTLPWGRLIRAHDGEGEPVAGGWVELTQALADTRACLNRIGGH